MLDSRQIAEWMAYFSMEPFGEHAAYWRSGVVAATIANVNRGKRSRAFKPEDFMPPEPRVKTKIQSVDEMAAVLKQVYKHAERHGMTKEKDK